MEEFSQASEMEDEEFFYKFMEKENEKRYKLENALIGDDVYNAKLLLDQAEDDDILCIDLKVLFNAAITKYNSEIFSLFFERLEKMNCINYVLVHLLIQVSNDHELGSIVKFLLKRNLDELVIELKENFEPEQLKRLKTIVDNYKYQAI